MRKCDEFGGIMGVVVKHLAIFAGDAIKHLLSGEKKIESRFSRINIPPYGVVRSGDVVYIKPPGGEIKGFFTVRKVVFWDRPGEREWALLEKWQSDLMIDNLFLQKRRNARYVSLMWVGEVAVFITPPEMIAKSDRRGWMVVGER